MKWLICFKEVKQELLKAERVSVTTIAATLFSNTAVFLCCLSTHRQKLLSGCVSVFSVSFIV